MSSEHLNRKLRTHYFCHSFCVSFFFVIIHTIITCRRYKEHVLHVHPLVFHPYFFNIASFCVRFSRFPSHIRFYTHHFVFEMFSSRFFFFRKFLVFLVIRIIMYFFVVFFTWFFVADTDIRAAVRMKVI